MQSEKEAAYLPRKLQGTVLFDATGSRVKVMLLVSSIQWSIFCTSRRTVKILTFWHFVNRKVMNRYPLDHSFCWYLHEKTIFDASAPVTWIKDKKAVFAKSLTSYQRIVVFVWYQSRKRYSPVWNIRLNFQSYSGLFCIGDPWRPLDEEETFKWISLLEVAFNINQCRITETFLLLGHELTLFCRIHLAT